MITAKHFSEKEFQALTPKCSLQDMKQELIDKLDKAREIAGVPFVLNCAYRSKEWDLSKGRNGKSAHTKGYAVDIRSNSSTSRLKVVSACIQAGFNRIGVGKTFVHVDCDPSLPQQVLFHYYD